MIPGNYNIEIYRGDKYYGFLITLPSLVPFGGPEDLTTATLKAQMKPKGDPETVLAEFEVEKVDAVLRKLRLKLTGAQTKDLPNQAVWDLQVSEGDDDPVTPLAGKVKVIGEVTQ